MIFLFSISFTLAILPAPVAAQLPAGTTPAKSEAEEPPVRPPVAPEFASPRAVLRTFLERLSKDQKKEAAELLDLSGFNAEARSVKGPELAYMLYAIMNRTVEMPTGDDWPPVDSAEAYEDVPADPEFEGEWSLAQLNRFTGDEAKQISIARNADGKWLFSKETVAAIEPLFALTEEAPLLTQEPSNSKTTKPLAIRYRDLFPEPLKRQAFLMPWYQWLSLLFIAMAGTVVERLVRWLFTNLGDYLLHRKEADHHETTAGVWRPVGGVANAATWYTGAAMLGLPLEFVGFLLVVLKLIFFASAVWAVFAVADLLAGYFSRRAKRIDRKFDDLVIPIATTTVKVVAVIVGIIAVTAAFNEELPTAILGGLGIGGIAIALASQETLSNFFGSITVLLDRPFEVGDWVLIEGIEGEVESVGFRSTRIRTGLNSQVTLPNSKLAASAIDNWGRRRYRRYLTTIGVEYDTSPDRIEAFCEGIRELIRRHPHTRKDFYACYFNNFGDSALEILLVCFFEVSDWPTELRERHRLLADIVRLAHSLNVNFAFPTQTVHLHQSELTPPDALRGDPTEQGQTLAADIAGELLNYQDRPGPVKFTGPTPVDVNRPEGS